VILFFIYLAMLLGTNTSLLYIMQQLLQYFRYFFYIAIHHNLVLAFRIIVDEIRGENKYRLNTTGVRVIKKEQMENPHAAHSNEYMPASYILMEKTFAAVNKHPHNKTFLDIGCGKGRTLFVAAAYGFDSISGIEFFVPYCDYAKAQIAAHQHEYPAASFSVTCADAATYIIPDAVQTIFFYNPFDDFIMKKVVALIVKSLERVYRPLFIIYLSPLYKQLFINEGFKEIYHTSRFGYLEGSVLFFEKDVP
jgi:SAM-dependent methyltransferase